MSLSVSHFLERMIAIWPYAALVVSMLFFASNHVLGRLIPERCRLSGYRFGAGCWPH